MKFLNNDHDSVIALKSKFIFEFSAPEKGASNETNKLVPREDQGTMEALALLRKQGDMLLADALGKTPERVAGVVEKKKQKDESPDGQLAEALKIDGAEKEPTTLQPRPVLSVATKVENLQATLEGVEPDIINQFGNKPGTLQAQIDAMVARENV